MAEYAKKYGYYLIVKDKLTYQGEIVSSTRIRETLALGNIEKVNAMLGEPFHITGTVIEGNRLGRTIGIPTINQTIPEHKLLPPDGVYASVVKIDGVSYYGITNIGYKPTVLQNKGRGVETYLFDCDQYLYGKEAVVQLHTFIRKEEKFSSLQELQKQIQEDIAKVKQYFGRYSL